MTEAADTVIAVVGTGIMGLGIAETAAVSGHTVRLFDSQAGKAEGAVRLIGASLDRRVSKGRMTTAEAKAALDRLQPVERLDELAGAAVIIEAIAEKLDAKQALMRSLEDVVEADCVLATNTSSFSVTEIASACKRPERVAGFHFFNPVPAMKIAEVIGGALTAPGVLDRLTSLAERFGHRAVRAADTPGFIVNHAGRGYVTEALAILREGVAPLETIDEILRLACNFRMGPFELLDLTGLDVSHPVMESIYGQFYQEPRYRPSIVTRQRLAAGLLGRKSGRGFYRYEDGMAVKTVEQPSAAPSIYPPSVRIVGDIPPAIAKLCEDAGVDISSAGKITLLPLVGEDASAACASAGADPRTSVGFDAVFGLETCRTIVKTPVTSQETCDLAKALFTSDGKVAHVVEDSVGAVCQRVVATIVNIAGDMVLHRIASASDIDTAVKLGLGYPAGPLEWGDGIGPATVHTMLRNMHGITGDPRYRPSLYLKRRAELGLALTT